MSEASGRPADALTGRSDHPGMAGDQVAVSAAGPIHSTAGGWGFPDGSLQLSAAGPYPAPVEVTGQTQCYDDASAALVPCAGTGQDGDLQRGIGWPSPRFRDNGDGTVTDYLTGLMWLKDAGCSAGTKTWQQARDWVGDLNTTAIACADYVAMTFTDWRLPNIRELQSLADHGQSGPALPPGHPFVNLQGFEIYWSSTTAVADPSWGWWGGLSFGSSNDDAKSRLGLALPVRGGR